MPVRGVCDTCHNGQVGTAKTEWPLATGHWLGTLGGYCEHCHDADPSTIGGIQAPTMTANLTVGHTTTSDYSTGNTAADKGCDVCHQFDATPHIDGALADTFASMRFKGTINGQAVATDVESACIACHHFAGADQGVEASTHGNTGFSGNTHDGNAEVFTYRCDACHDPHGTANIYMVRAAVEVSNYVGTGDDSQTVAVSFTSASGAGSYDDGTADSVCSACHGDANRPGSGSTMANTDGQHVGLDVYSTDEQGNDCSGCHNHDPDGTASTDDAFLPQDCGACHSYPPASNAHGRHLDGGTDYSYDCTECHDMSTAQRHERGRRGGVHLPDRARCRRTSTFDFTAGLSAGGSYGGDVTKTCSAIYCHGIGDAGLGRG